MLGLPPERCLLLGFSQGGSLAAYTALRAPWRLGGVAVLGSRGAPALVALRAPRALQCHGSADGMVSEEAALASVARLRGHGCETSFKRFEGGAKRGRLGAGQVLAIPSRRRCGKRRFS